MPRLLGRKVIDTDFGSMRPPFNCQVCPITGICSPEIKYACALRVSIFKKIILDVDSMLKIGKMYSRISNLVLNRE